eukprot:NODE_5726_length_915_cov_104.719697_g5502_i0.p1 GENE.NODE_5726_length_915_cov_104.719697_g5502_i0~~NODE_5726_length_915_cov_104.719697_g5502_i0.p1  ORF type:complete len:185 (-),score=20.94 NODE_5726_length_915_cov_104.719697_g5502_i0:296-850(-)
MICNFLRACFCALLCCLSAADRPSFRSSKKDIFQLRPTSCDGTNVTIPAKASVGVDEDGNVIQLLRELDTRDDIVGLVKDLGLMGRAVELGVHVAGFATDNLRAWKGKLYVLVDYWGGVDLYGDRRDHVYQKAMKWVAPFRHRIKVMRSLTTDAVKKFPDNYFDWIYLDATHTYNASLRDLREW